MKRYRLKKQNRPNLIIKNMTTTRLSHEGRGIGSLNGKTVFIQDALADEIVDYELLNRKKNYEEGRCVQVHQTSNDRVDPFCKHYSRCGGCTLQHMNESAQIVFKQKVLLELLSRTGNCNPDKILLPIIGPVKHYRHKARLSVRYIEKKKHASYRFS